MTFKRKGFLLCFALFGCCFALLCFALLCFGFALLCFSWLGLAWLCFAWLCFALLCFSWLGLTSSSTHTPNTLLLTRRHAPTPPAFLLHDMNHRALAILVLPWFLNPASNLCKPNLNTTVGSRTTLTCLMWTQPLTQTALTLQTSSM